MLMLGLMFLAFGIVLSILGSIFTYSGFQTYRLKQAIRTNGYQVDAQIQTIRPSSLTVNDVRYQNIDAQIGLTRVQIINVSPYEVIENISQRYDDQAFGQARPATQSRSSIGWASLTERSWLAKNDELSTSLWLTSCLDIADLPLDQSRATC